MSKKTPEQIKKVCFTRWNINLVLQYAFHSEILGSVYS